MATITSAASGNFSAGATWVGGVVPTTGDNAVAATGHTVVIDVDTTVDKVSQEGTGKFTLGNGRTLTANVEANVGTFTSGGTVDVVATTTATIVGNVTGVSTTTTNSAGVVVSGTGALTLTGTVTGSAGNNSSEANGSAGVYTNVNSTITINGAVTGGTGTHKRGFQAGASSNGTFTIVGNVTAGSGSQAYGAFTAGTSASLTVTGSVTGGSGTVGRGIFTSGSSATLTITGNVTGGSVADAIGAVTTGTSATLTIIGNVTGGTASNATGAESRGNTATITITGNVTGGTATFGVYGIGATNLISVVGNLLGVGQSFHAVRSDASAANSGVVLTGNMTDSSLGATALYTRIFRLNATTSGTTTYTNNVGYPTGGSVTRVSPDLTTGMPTAANVRFGTVFGAGGALTGSLRVPPANAVGAGVLVDNTTGTAALSPADIAGLVGAQIAAAVSSP